MQRWTDSLQSAALLVLGAISFVYFGPLVDKMFPVVDPFVVVEKEFRGDVIIISGWLHKRRECEFMEASGRVEVGARLPLVVPVEFGARRTTYTRPMGTQEWGPWRIVVPAGAEQVTVSSLHSCHLLWKTRTELATIKVNK